MLSTQLLSFMVACIAISSPLKISVPSPNTEINNIYFRVRFGLVNSINTRLFTIKNRVAWKGEMFSIKYVIIKLVLPNQSLIYIFISEIFKPVFSTNNLFSFESVFGIPNGYLLVEKQF